MISRSTLIALAAVLAVPAAATASSVTYVDGKNVWIASPDGAIKRQLTTDGTEAVPYHLPSGDDAGNVVAFKGGNSSSKVITVIGPDGAQTNNVMPWKTSTWVNIGPNSAKVSPSGGMVAYTYYWNHGPYSGYPMGGMEHRIALVPPKAPGLPTNPLVDQPTWDAPTWIDGKLVVVKGGKLHLETSPLQFQEFLGINPPSQGVTVDILRGEVSRPKDRYLVHLRASTGAQDLVLYQHTGPFPGGEVPAGCWIATAGAVDRAWGLSPDGRQVTWADSAGVHVGTFTPSQRSGTGQCLGDVITLSATGDEPQFGDATLTVPQEPVEQEPAPVTEPAPPAPAPAPAPAPRPAPVPAPRPVVKPAERATGPLAVVAPPATTVQAVARGLAVRATAPGPGTLSIRLRSGGRTLATGRRKATKAGALSVALTASKAGRAALRRLKGKRLSLAVTFAPRGGGPRVTSTSAIRLR